MYVEVKYLFCFFVVAKCCFSLSIVEVECIIIIEVTLQNGKQLCLNEKVHTYKQKCIQIVSILLGVQITGNKEKHTAE